MRTILDTADALQQDLTADQAKSIEEHTKAVKELEAKIASARHDLFVLQTVRELAEEIGAPVGDGDSTSSGIAEKSRRLSFKGMGAGVAKQMLDANTKALAPSSAAVVGQEFTGDPVALGQVATGLLDVLPTKTHTSAEYA